MKKILTSVLVLTLCGAMFTACGSDSADNSAELETEASVTVSETVSETEAETTAETTTAAEVAAETETETEAETEAETTASEAASYASIDEFSKSGEAFTLSSDTTPAADSITYNFLKIFDGAKEIYLDVESTDGSMTMIMGMSNSGIYAKTTEAESGAAATIIFKDNVMYMLDDTSKSGYYMTADENMMEQYDIESMLSEINMNTEIENAADVKVCTVEIGGEICTFEVVDTGAGFLFSNDGTLYAILSNDTDQDLTAILVNEFTTTVPADILEVPSDYTLVDLAASLSE